jgi:ribonuclease R
MGTLYRIHEKPDPKRIYDFEMIAASFGYSLGVGALPIKRVQTKTDRRAHYGSGRRPPTVELPEEVHLTPRMYQKLVQKIAGKPEERVLSFLMLRSLKQARYSEVNEGHFALAAPCYTHFTSPIRRYPDLIVHRILKDVLRGEGRPEHGTMPTYGEHASPWSKRAPGKPGKESITRPLKVVAGYTEERLHEVADSSSQAERAADEAERELMEWKKLKFMEQRIGEAFDGLIISVTKYGFFVELTDLFVEGLVPITTLEDDHYTFRENTRQIVGERTRKTFSIGDRVRVIVDRIDHMQRKVQFALLEERPGKVNKPGPSKAKSKMKDKAEAKAKIKDPANIKAQKQKRKGRK